MVLLDANESDTLIITAQPNTFKPIIHEMTDASDDATYVFDLAGYSNTEVQVSQDDDGVNVVTLKDVKTVPIDLGSYTDDILVVSTPDTDPNELSPYVI